ncbi:hypothetical protein CK203_047389 [Vitis vinifera]|uniref:Small ribosomal subunit protein bS18c n=1 Tax=Vitis vinifera TaxID=29760 RepID=A0A438G1W0_VITVI|nr:hypothetical protein CK203_047389 [Vitis vinifera]
MALTCSFTIPDITNHKFKRGILLQWFILFYNASQLSADDFEHRIFAGTSGSNPNSDSFYQKLDRLEKAHDIYRLGSKLNGGSGSQFLDGLDESFNTLSDGMDGKLKKEATYFEFNPDEIDQEDYAFRPDVAFKPGMTYEPKDLDLTKPGIRKSYKRPEFEVTTEEVLRKADFRVRPFFLSSSPWIYHIFTFVMADMGLELGCLGSHYLHCQVVMMIAENVRFLAHFITEAGIIIKRSKTGISAKAQRKVAREIKTARAFGLMPFTTMGTKAFVFGKTMEDLDEDFEYYRSVDPEETQDPLDPPLEP